MSHFDDLLAGPLTRLVLCWRIVREDGVVLGFTAHDQTLDIDGQPYSSAPALLPSALARSSDTRVDNLEVTGALSHASISEADLLAGRYQGARLSLFMVDWAEPDAGRIDLAQGLLGPVTSDGQQFSAQLRGRTAQLDRSIVELVSPECRAELGDKRCRAALRRFSRFAAAVNLPDAQTVDADGLSTADNGYAYGRLLWITGDNSGTRSDIMQSSVISETGFDSARVRLLLRDLPSAPIRTGDRFEISLGCDKRYVTCLGRFGNQLNFRGEPFVPGIDSVLRYPDA